MNDLFYPMIFKRKSFHVFKTNDTLSSKDLEEIKRVFYEFIPLVSDIKVKIEIVPKSDTTCKRGEYCILLYSEKKKHYLKNIGYIGEQLDLWLAAKNIGVCWYGAGKNNNQYYTDLEFVIMLAIQKVPDNQFRQDMFRSKRKSIPEIWQGKAYHDIANIVRFAPSACNLQPWFVVSEKGELNVYKIISTKRGIMPANKVDYYSEIDMGIFICFLEICIEHEKLSFCRKLYDDNKPSSDNKLLNANYQILQQQKIY